MAAAMSTSVRLGTSVRPVALRSVRRAPLRVVAAKGGEEGGKAFGKDVVGILSTNGNYNLLAAAIGKVCGRPVGGSSAIRNWRPPRATAPAAPPRGPASHRVPRRRCIAPARRRRRPRRGRALGARCAQSRNIFPRTAPRPIAARAARHLPRTGARPLTRRCAHPRAHSSPPSQAGLAEALSGPGPFTVLAPDDDAFMAVAKSLKLTKMQLLELPNLADILKCHVISGKVLSTDLKEGMEAATLGGKKLKVTLAGGAKFNTSKVKKANVPASNGVIHGIDSVILP